MPGALAAKRKRGYDEICGVVSDNPPANQGGGCLSDDGAVKHTLLSQYYPRLRTLRAYVLEKLPSSSRLRRRKISSVGSPRDTTVTDAETQLCRLLDSTLVGSHAEGQPRAGTLEVDGRWQKWLDFSQTGDESYVSLSDGVSAAYCSQSELIDFVIWLLFEREGKGSAWPKHLLCDGYRRSFGSRAQGQAPAVANTIPGIFLFHPNPRVQSLKEAPWPQLLSLLGRAGERLMIDLLLDETIFLSIRAGRDNYYQLSGKHLADLHPLCSNVPNTDPGGGMGPSSIKPPSEITIVRTRMLYARATLNAHGRVHFGLRHIHVLNRFPHRPDGPTDNNNGDGDGGQVGAKPCPTIHVMMYIFPRQFGLHNVFTSSVDRSKTAQKFQDYTLREDEILERFGPAGKDAKQGVVRLPRRLRGVPKALVERLQVYHGRCSYSELLQHYCPAQTKGPGATQASARKRQSTAKSHRRWSRNQQKEIDDAAPETLEYTSLTDLATPIARVSAFSQAVFKKILPDEFWGSGETQTRNKAVFLKKVDHFIRLRRFEVLNLHDMCQDLAISQMEWLAPPGLRGKKTSKTDMQKRNEIFMEFLYYLVDSILIPLIRSNFYVTESNIHKNRLFFFRHDVWRYIAEPAMVTLKTKMFEEVKLEDAMRILDSRQLGFSQLRLLPKAASVRPIMNLRRRTATRRDRKTLGPSINTILGPLHAVLQHEKTSHLERLGSTMFSVGDMYQRIKDFKERQRSVGKTFYFAKVDVKAAFDTIPQTAILSLMNRMPLHHQYSIQKYFSIQPDQAGTNAAASAGGTKPSRRWRSTAKGTGQAHDFRQLAEQQLAPNKRNTVFVESVVQTSHDTRGLLALLSSHVEQNLVKIGKKYFRQKDGIPQGSILSSLLCNHFYADLEREHLSFLQGEGEGEGRGDGGGGDSLLLRLIDDFLLITTDRAKASRFVRVMHAGLPAYGVRVSPSKTLVSFDLVVDGAAVARVAPGRGFPYCGTLLDTRTLDIAKDRDRVPGPVVVGDALTVEFARAPGRALRRKVLHAFRIQSHLMYFDTTHNAPHAVLRNVHEVFVETATKMWAYVRCLPRAKRPRPALVVDTIKEVVDVAYLLLTSKSRTSRYPGYKCAVNKAQVTWLAMHAFRRVLKRKQSGYKEIIDWLDGQIEELRTRKDLRLPRDVSQLVDDMSRRTCQVRKTDIHGSVIL